MKKFLFSLLFLPSLLTAEVIETDLLARVQWGNGDRQLVTLKAAAGAAAQGKAACVSRLRNSGGG
jgi:hypothetical protein